MLDRILEGEPDSKASRVDDPAFDGLLTIIRPYSMVSKKRLFSLFSLARQVCLLDLPGNFVECGVAAGGSSALLAHVIKRYSKRPRSRGRRVRLGSRDVRGPGREFEGGV